MNDGEKYLSRIRPYVPKHGELPPTNAALAFATSLDEKTFNDIYACAARVDAAFQLALEETRQDERDRIFRMGFWDLLREYWRGKKIKKNRS